jgi:hypothetical protein
VDDLHTDHHVEEYQDRNSGHKRRKHLYPRMYSYEHIAVAAVRTKGKSR